MFLGSVKVGQEFVFDGIKYIKLKVDQCSHNDYLCVGIVAYGVSVIILPDNTNVSLFLPATKKAKNNHLTQSEALKRIIRNKLKRITVSFYKRTDGEYRTITGVNWVYNKKHNLLNCYSEDEGGIRAIPVEGIYEIKYSKKKYIVS